MNQDIEETLADIAEMAQEGYLCFVNAYNELDDEYEVVWTNKAGRGCGFWGSRQCIVRLFNKALLN